VAEPKSIRKTRSFYAQSLRSEVSPKQWIHGSSIALQALRKSQGFCVTGGLPPIASEPTPSPRLWAASPGATRAKPCETHEVSLTKLKTGTFYFGESRNFLFWSDIEILWPKIKERR
jgi:hypothetical protein